jgi:hypothetical protein
MKVYEVRGDYKRFAGLLYKDSRVQAQFYQRTPGKSLIPEWENIEVKKATGGDGLTTSIHSVGNFAVLEMYENPTFDDAAKAALEPHISQYGEFLPVRYSSQTRWMFNCLHLVAAIDLETSVVRRETVPPYEIRQLKWPLYFKPELLVKEWIFLPSERPYEIFVTDKFVKVVEDHKLTGFSFNEIWDSNDKPPAQKPIDPALMTRHDLN